MCLIHCSSDRNSPPPSAPQVALPPVALTVPRVEFRGGSRAGSRLPEFVTTVPRERPAMPKHIAKFRQIAFLPLPVSTVNQQPNVAAAAPSACRYSARLHMGSPKRRSEFPAAVPVSILIATENLLVRSEVSVHKQLFFASSVGIPCAATPAVRQCSSLHGSRRSIARNLCTELRIQPPCAQSLHSSRRQSANIFLGRLAAWNKCGGIKESGQNPRPPTLCFLPNAPRRAPRLSPASRRPGNAPISAPAAPHL